MRKSELESEVALWKSVLLIFHSGSFSKGAQNRLLESLGDEMLESVKSFFELYPLDEFLDEIPHRLNETLSLVVKKFSSSAKNIENTGFEMIYRIAGD